MTDPDFERIDAAKAELEAWLVRQAEAGVPELALVRLLEDTASEIDQLESVPRVWQDLESECED